LIFELIKSERIFAITISEIWPIIFGIFITYRLLTRRKTRSTIFLSIYFLGFSLVFVISFISLFFIGTSFSKILYSVSLYLLIFDQGLPIYLSWIMIRQAQRIKPKSTILILLIYGLSASYVFWIGFLLNGIIYGPNTGWRPEYSVLFFWFTFCYLTIFFIIPELILVRKLITTYKRFLIWNRVKLYIAGVFLLYLDLYFVLIYNTWIDNLLYRTIHLTISIPLSTVGALLIYLGFGRNLVNKN
jgi:hypothetical protein